MKKTFAVMLLGMAAAAGCAEEEGKDRSAAKVTSVEVTTQTGTTTSIRRMDAQYAESQLRQVLLYVNGTPSGSNALTYGPKGITKIEMTDKEGDRATQTLTYEADRIMRVRYEVAGVMASDSDITYDPARAYHAKEIKRTATYTGAAPDVTFTRYEFDTTGRTTRILTIRGTETDTTELSYAPDGLLERATVFSGSKHVETYMFFYDAEKRVQEVTDTHNNRYSVMYGSDGHISETRRIDAAAGSTTTVRYTYGSGEVEGITFAPVLPMSTWFDLEGKGVSVMSLLHGVPEIQADIPRAAGTGGGSGGGSGGGGGGGGGGTMTCSFTPQDACETCLAASCCSQTEQCFTGTPCDTWYQCVTACNGDATCRTGCNEQYPQGYSDFQSFASCAQSFCPTTCGS